MNMSQSVRSSAWGQFPEESVTLQDSRAYRLTSQAMKAAALALILAIVVIGAADNIDLPDRLQFFLSHLDVATYFPMATRFDSPTRALLFWVLPINALFYSFLVFAYFSWRARQAGPKLVSAPGPLDATLPSSSASVVDPNISTMAAVLNGAELVKHLGTLSTPQWWSSLQEAEVRVLRWHSAERCAFEIVFRADLVGKVYAVDRWDVYEVMDKLSRGGFGRDAEYSVPQPVAYIPSLRLLLQEKVQGVAAKKVFRFGDEQQRAKAAECCGRWLARYHATAPMAGRALTAEKFLRRVERKHHLVVEAGGRLAAKSQVVFDELTTVSKMLSTVPMCAGHGDFGSFHVIFGDRRTVVFDWDLYDVADPARDVARFIVSLERQALQRLDSIHALDNTSEIFLKTYLDSGGPPQAVANLSFYKAAHCLRGAAWDVRTNEADWSERAEAMLEEALRDLRSDT